MATKLHGLLNLTKIGQLTKENKGRIFTNSKGEQCIWVDVLEKRTPDMYGSTHTITFYDKESGTVYLADLKPQEFGGANGTASSPAAPVSNANRVAAPAPAPQEEQSPDDFPF